MSEFIEVLVLPLGFSIHDLVVDILTIDNQIMLDVEDEVPRVSEGLGHLTELVEVCANCSLALFELIGDVVNDLAHVLNALKN